MSGIEVRNVRFDIDDDVPRHWHGGRRSVTLFFDNLSIFFPAGERFFIASVNAHRDAIDSDELRAQVRDFCAQEAVHTREHIRYNDMLARHDVPTEKMDGRVARLLRFVRKVTPKRFQLAATCALEHFTALMAHLLLSDPRVLEGAHPSMAALWRWHAAEENEHKAVAYDVYQRAGGNYFERCGVMIVATIVFWAKVFEHQVRLMHRDGILWSPREWARLAKFVFWSPGWAVKLAPMYLQYFKPGFHPWDLDNRDLLDDWKTEYATSEEYHHAA